MLSESASVGAKVLGKLAGTEIVDKSISEVNKKTHQTRSDISYADKQIGEIDVSLTEYFDLDRFDAELKTAEAAFIKLKEDQSRHAALMALMNGYQLNTEQRIKYYDEVERLAGVVVASVSLGIAEREQAKKEKLEELNVGFWKAVQDQNEPLRVIRLTRNLEDLQTGLKEVEANQDTYEKLIILNYRNDQLQKTIFDTSALVVKLDQAVGLSFMLDDAEKDTQALEALERAYKQFKDASEEERDLRYKVSSLGNTEALADILGSISKQYDELDNLKRLNAVSLSRQLSYESAGRYLEKCNKELEEAQEELQVAWEAAGGVCPLCGSEVKENCTH